MAPRQKEKEVEDEDEFSSYVRVVVDRIFGQDLPECHDAVIAPHLHLYSASLPPTVPYPTVIFSLVVPQSLANLGGTLHGGAISLIFDDVTTLALNIAGWQAARVENAPGWVEGWQWGGVSRTLNVSYLRPLPVGEKVWVTAEVVGGLGRKLAYTRGTMTIASSGKVAATCEHHKANTKADTPPETKATAKL